MAKWLPIHCPICQTWHEQPEAADKVVYCQDLLKFGGYEQLEQIHTYKLSKRESAVLSGFPELSEA